jgi:hypothetical protein
MPSKKKAVILDASTVRDIRCSKVARDIIKALASKVDSVPFAGTNPTQDDTMAQLKFYETFVSEEVLPILEKNNVLMSELAYTHQLAVKFFDYAIGHIESDTELVVPITRKVISAVADNIDSLAPKGEVDEYAVKLLAQKTLAPLCEGSTQVDITFMGSLISNMINNTFNVVLAKMDFVRELAIAYKFGREDVLEISYLDVKNTLEERAKSLKKK